MHVFLQVNASTLCVHGRSLEDNPRGFIGQQVMQFWKQKYEEAKDIPWIFFGTEEGVMYNYPSTYQHDPNYDPRYR